MFTYIRRCFFFALFCISGKGNALLHRAQMEISMLAKGEKQKRYKNLNLALLTRKTKKEASIDDKIKTVRMYCVFPSIFRVSYVVRSFILKNLNVYHRIYIFFFFFFFLTFACTNTAGDKNEASQGQKQAQAAK